MIKKLTRDLNKNYSQSPKVEATQTPPKMINRNAEREGNYGTCNQMDPFQWHHPDDISQTNTSWLY